MNKKIKKNLRKYMMNEIDKVVKSIWVVLYNEAKKIYIALASAI
jgi:hypothetical protein